MSEEFLNEVKKVISKRISPVVADSAIRISCERIGIVPENLNKDKLDIFIDNIKISLLIFLEDEEIDNIVKEIKEIDLN